MSDNAAMADDRDHLARAIARQTGYISRHEIAAVVRLLERHDALEEALRKIFGAYDHPNDSDSDLCAAVADAYVLLGETVVKRAGER